MKRQFWLAELDRYGNAKLIDGPHNDREGVETAAALHEALGLRSGQPLTCAEVLVTDLTGAHGPINREAVAILNATRPPEDTER